MKDKAKKRVPSPNKVTLYIDRELFNEFKAMCVFESASKAVARFMLEAIKYKPKVKRS